MSYYALIASVSALGSTEGGREGEVIKEEATKRAGRGKLQWVSGWSLFVQGAKCKWLF